MNAAAIRLRQALEEYTRSISGDTGSRRGGLRSQINAKDRELHTLATGLLSQLGGGEGSSGDHAARNTPGSRARDRATTGGPQMGSPRDQARALLGAPGAMNGPAPADQGGTSQ